uniref:Uncharacterized protein n=1 Tax=Anguilla anguilla TaxID=7936 RepID=A0A0E9QX66_ANGAN
MAACCFYSSGHGGRVGVTAALEGGLLLVNSRKGLSYLFGAAVPV